MRVGWKVICSQAWKVRADIVIKLKWNRHSWNVTNNLWKRFQHEYGNEAVGPEKAIENLRKDCTKELATPGQGIIKEHDWISDYESLTGWAKDMKTNPEKYRGCCCGISTIDERTNGGFRPGHLTVFVGRPGGYKTTMLLNIAHGLWNAGYDVLYVSLEMEAKLLELKFWCRATGELDYTKLFRGLISEPGDRQCLADVTTALTKADLNPEEKAKLESQKRKLEEILAGVQPGNEDSEILARFEQSSKSKKNRIKIINIGQSKKIRMSQIERYLRDVESDFRPQVVIIDYCSLTLVAPETPYPDRPDLELGEICTYMRNLGENMGFSVITAAQLKRAALERIRKYGEGAPEKAQIGTDDIAESHQISAAADTIFVLWPMANSQIKIFCPKARHAGFDMSQGETLQVCDLQCMISTGENIQSHTEASKGKSLSEGRKQNLEIFNNYDKPTDSEPLSGSGHFVGGGGVKSLPVDF